MPSIIKILMILMMQQTDRRMIIATTIGSAFELFDFLSFVFLSEIIAHLFFPPQYKSFAIIFTYFTITMSYVLRPIGGLILGHFGDIYGRKSVFSISILLMSIPSFLIGVLPTFSTWGYFATTLLIIARIMQGFSVGGEVPGSITYIAEKFKSKNYFFYCAWLTFGANLGVVLGAQLVRLISDNTSRDFMLSFGWRIPFLLGGVLTIIGFYIRRVISESEQFQELKQTKLLNKTPLKTVFTKYRSQVISGTMLCMTVSVITSVFHVFLPNLFIAYFHLSMNASANVSTIGAITMAVFSLIVAYFTRITNVFIWIRSSIGGLFVAMLILGFNVIDLKLLLSQNTTMLYVIVFVISLLLSGVNGLFFGILANLFPTEVRFSGVSASYNFAYILGAGLTPLWTSGLLKVTHGYQMIIWVCAVIVLVGFINTIYLKYLLKDKLF